MSRPSPRAIGVLIGIAFVLLLIAAVFVARSRSFQLWHHREGWLAAAKRMGEVYQGQPISFWERHVRRINGVGDFERFLSEHEKALFALNYLEEREFPAGRPLNDCFWKNWGPRTKNGGHSVWKARIGGTNKNSIIVTAPRADMPFWERQFAEALKSCATNAVVQ
jgi:hypothetical protein